MGRADRPRVALGDGPLRTRPRARLGLSAAGRVGFARRLLASLSRVGSLPDDLRGIAADARQETDIRTQLDRDHLDDAEREKLEHLLQMLEAEYDWAEELRAAREPWEMRVAA